MIFTKNSHSFGCVMFMWSSLMLLNNCVLILAIPYSNVNKIDSTKITDRANASLPQQSHDKTKIFFDGASEYHVNFRFNANIRHAESGEYEMQNGRQVFVIRGLFQYFSEKDNITIIRPYIFDEHGYHEIENVIGMRGDEFDSECDLSAGQYCIDPKLLKIMIG